MLPIHLLSLTHRRHCHRYHSVTFTITSSWFHHCHHGVAFAVSHGFIVAIAVSPSSLHHRSVVIAVSPLSSHHRGVIVAVSLSPLWCCLCYCIIMVLLSLFRHCCHCFTVTIELLWCCVRYCGVTFIVAVSRSLLWCCSCCCSVAVIVAVLHSLLWCCSHCCGVELIGTAERAVTAEPEALRMGALAF